jgi:hypothetical protein
MKQPKLLLKAAVITSSGMLVAGCVSFHSGAFDGTKQGESPRAAPSVMSGSKALLTGQFLSVDNSKGKATSNPPSGSSPSP